MNPVGSFSGNTLTISWSPLPEASEYALSVERCDNERCSRVWTGGLAGSKESQVSATSTDFGPCTLYNLEISALSDKDSRFRVKETSLLRKECPQVGILVAGVLVSAIVIILGLLALLFYHRKRHFGEIQRARSKVYTRLYAKDKYERPRDKYLFLQSVPELLRELDEEEEESRFVYEEGSGGREDDDSELAREFRDLESISFDTIQRKTRAADSAVNRRRNRYQDVVPFDATRVKLDKPLTIQDVDEPSDYINASYVSGFVSVHSPSFPIKGGSYISSNSSTNVISKSSSHSTRYHNYIAAQGPGIGTAPLFWEMIWQQNVRVIIMLTNCVEGYGYNAVKCTMYWPHLVGAEKRFNSVQVQLYDVQEAPDYTIRKFDVSNASTLSSSGGNREIVHIQYNAWPDRTAPSDPEDLLQLIKVARVLTTMYNNTENPGPILVHCSAGVGRSGTYIAVDQLTRMLDCDKNSKIDVFNTVYQLRRDRRHMVQTLAQYAYVYKCVLAYIRCRKEDDDEDGGEKMSSDNESYSRVNVES